MKARKNSVHRGSTKGDQMNITELKRFCSTDDSRISIQAPWTHDGYTWATNGHILVRVPEMVDVPENTFAPDCSKLLAKQPQAVTWFLVPKCSMPAPLLCQWCSGTSKDKRNRRRKCNECKGSRTVENDIANLMVSGTCFAKRYLALIQGWKIAPNGKGPAWIRHSDALGLLMPIYL